MKKIHIIDALGPFVLPSNQPALNWSKVDFSNLESYGHLGDETISTVCERFTRYLLRVKKLGYDSFSFDDVAHLARFSWYNPEIKSLLDEYAELYDKLFTIAKQHDMAIYINTDYLFSNQTIREYMTSQSLSNEDFFVMALENMFESYEQIDGIILRIGENDGKDVDSHFLSRLALRTPKSVNSLLRRLVPLFESRDKTLIFRTWTVGVYKVGDLIWNQKTLAGALENIRSDAFVLSMKFGDTDFMRYLKLNPLISTDTHLKIIEFQTRREWEGMGMLPSFVGYDYEHYIAELRDNETIVGIHVWCQTGGWAKSAWTNLTYLDNSSFWNELNTFVTLQLYKRNCATKEAIELFCTHSSMQDADTFVRLLELCDIAIKKGYYIREFAEQELYFRRSRVPTLLWITWDKVLLQPIILFLIRTSIKHPKRAIQESVEAVEAAREMVEIGHKLKLDISVRRSLEDLEATLDLFVDIRRYMLSKMTRSEVSRLRSKARLYMKKYPHLYTIPHISPLKISSRYARLSRYPLRAALRSTALYRKRDRVLLATSSLQRQLVRYYMYRSKSDLKDQSMGVDSLFK